MKVKQSVSVSPLPTFFVFCFYFWEERLADLKKREKEKGTKDRLIADEIMIADRFARL